MRSGLLILSALALGACTVGPTYQRPSLPTPQAWRDAAPVRDTSIGDWPWWLVFRDTTLQQLVRAALARNTDVRLAAERVGEARAQLRMARGAQLPSLYGYASAAAGGSDESGYDRFGVTASASWELDIFGRWRSSSESARAWLLASEEYRRGVALLVVSEVASAYAELRAADRQIEIARQTVEARRRYVDLTRRRLESSPEAEIDFRQAQGQYEAARSLTIDLQQSIAQAEDALSVLLGRAPGTVPRSSAIEGDLFAAAAPPGLPSRLLERRPDVRAAERQLAASTADIGAVKAQLFPRLALNGTVGYSSTTSRVAAVDPTTGAGSTQSYSSDYSSWSLGASISQPIFVGGQQRAAVSSAESRARQAAIAYERVVLEALGEADARLVAVRLAGERKVALDSLAAHRRAVLRLAEARYERGTGPFLEVLDAQRESLSAELGAIAARRTQATALIGLYKALGGGWQTDSTATGAATGW